MKKSRQEIRTKLITLKEKELRALLVEVFSNLKFNEVIESHGINEFGKDIVFWDEDKLKRKIWYACVVKTKDINQKIFDEVARQINECFRVKYSSLKQGKVKIDQVIVITNGIYKDNAKSQIAELFDGNKTANKVEYWEVGDIAEKIENTPIVDVLFEKNSFTQNLYNKAVLEIISNESSLKLLENDFDVNIGKLDDFQIKVRAKATEFENEREEYLKSFEINHTKVPVKFLPDIDVLLKTRKPLFIHGIATSGKTTILKKFGKDFIKNGEDGYVFFIELSRYKEKIIESGILPVLCEIFETITNEKISFEKIEKDKKLLILLDGLDELPDSQIQEIIIAKSIELISNDNVRLVISSRTSEFIETNGSIKNNFNVFELLPLSFNEMVELGGKILPQDDKRVNFVKLYSVPQN